MQFRFLFGAMVGLMAVAGSMLSAADLEVKDPALLPGDKAPAFTVAKFVKGDELKGFEKGKVYIVECWATWCGPCLQSIPHLTEIQEKHKDVTVVGIAVSDPDIEKIEEFVTDQGDKMGYTVAWEGKPTKRGPAGMPEFSKNWMDAAGARGIPHAFIVDGKGEVAWMGHPMAMDKALAKILDGSWDTKAFREEHLTSIRSEAEEEAFQQKLTELDQEGDTDAMLELLGKYEGKSPKFKQMCTVGKIRIMGSKPKYAKELLAYLTEVTADTSKTDPELVLNIVMASLQPNDAEGLTELTGKWPKELKAAFLKAAEDERLGDFKPYDQIAAAKAQFVTGDRKKAAATLNGLAKTLKDPRQGRMKLQLQQMAQDLGGEEDAEEPTEEKEEKAEKIEKKAEKSPKKAESVK